MSATTALTDDAADTAGRADRTTTAGRARARWRRWRWPLVVAGLLLLVVVIGALTVPRGTTGRLDPTSAEPDGARALAQVLADQGVPVRRVTRSADVVGAGTDVTLVVVDTRLLAPEQLDRLARTSAVLVLVEPDAVTLDALAPGVRPAGVVEPRTSEPVCRNTTALAAGEVRAGGHLYGSTVASGALCYPDDRDDTVGSFVATTVDRRSVVVLGQGELLMNEHLGRDGNAALALRTLGTRPQVLWYLPDPLELAASQAPPTLGELLPDGVRWAAVQLSLVVALALLWRGRRLGALVSEPLPVVVRAAETQEGRARLYRQARARGRAAATLRTATLRRLAQRLDVGHDATPDTLAALVAGTTGLPERQVHATLLGPAPPDDGALVRLADQLDVLEHALLSTDRSSSDHTRKAQHP